MTKKFKIKNYLSFMHVGFIVILIPPYFLESLREKECFTRDIRLSFPYSVRRLAAVSTLTITLTLGLWLESFGASQSDDETISKEIEIPLIETELKRPITILDLLELRDITALSVSPSGEYAALHVRQAELTSNSYRTAWFVVPTDKADEKRIKAVGKGGKPPQIIYGLTGHNSGAWNMQPPVWSPDEQWIAYLVKDKLGKQIWVSHREHGRQRKLTHRAGDVEELLWAPDSSKVFFTVSPPQTRIDEMVRKEGEKGFHFDERFWPWWSSMPVWMAEVSEEINWPGGRDGSRFVRKELWVYDWRSKQERRATPRESVAYRELQRKTTVPNTENLKGLTWTDDRDGKVWLLPKLPEKQGYNAPLTLFGARADEGWVPHECAAAPCTGQIKALWWTASDQEVIFLRAEGVSYATTGLYAWSIESGEVRAVLKTDDLLIDCNMAASAIICFHESSLTPRRLVAIDLTSGMITTLFDPNPEFKNLLLSEATKLVWNDEAGIETFGRFVRPLNYIEGRQYPLIITTYHSRGFLRGGVGDEVPIQVLAANGFCVFDFNAPKNWELAAVVPSGMELTQIDRKYGDNLERALRNLGVAIDILIEMGVVNGERVGLTGLSYGAEITLYAISHSKKFAAASVSTPGTDPLYYYLAGPSMQRTIRGWYGPPAAQNAAKSWGQVSVALNADKVTTPLLIQAADREYILGLQTFTALKDAGKPVELYVFPEERHIKWQPIHRYNVYRRNLQWFNYWLRDLEDEIPVDPSQYARWQQLTASPPD